MFSTEIMSTLHAIESHFKQLHDKQNLTLVVYIHMIKAICHMFKTYDQTSVGTFDVANETLENKVKMPVFMIFYVCCCFRRF